MFIQQLYTGCLSEAAYYIESEGKAAIIDPLRDIEVYLNLAKERNAEIIYIFETHIHADFVSGHLDLSKATRAPIIFGPEAKPRYEITKAKDLERFPLGAGTIEVLHTPGHTPESSCYLLRDEKDQPQAIFTGDTLFIGDVGRPDLSQKNAAYSAEEMAGQLFQSLRTKIMNLPDHVIVYPAHGAGSSCGKNMSAETFSTLGEQKQSNYALQPVSKEDFIEAVTEGLNTAPSYFPINAMINQNGYESLNSLLTEALKPLGLEEFKSLLEEDQITVLDTRNGALFTEGFIPGSIFIGLEGRFAEWAGSLLSYDQPIVLITTPGMEKESFTRLARVGFSKFAGFLDGGFETWENAGEKIDMVINIETDELAMDMPFDDQLLVIDVRREGEFNNGHVKDAVNLPLEDIIDPGSMAHIDDRQNLYIHCASGYRSVIAASIMKKQGYHNLRNVEGGWKAIQLEKRIATAVDAKAMN